MFSYAILGTIALVIIFQFCISYDPVACLVIDSGTEDVNGYYSANAAFGSYYGKRFSIARVIPDCFEMAAWRSMREHVALYRSLKAWVISSSRKEYYVNVAHHDELNQAPETGWVVKEGQSPAPSVVSYGTMSDSDLTPKGPMSNYEVMKSQPVTMAIIFVILGYGYYLWNNRVDVNDISCSYDSIVHRRQYTRILTSSLAHVDLLHIGFNLMSLYQLGGLEAYVYGSFQYAYLSLNLVVQTILVMLAASWALSRYSGDRAPLLGQSIGYSCVLFAWMVVSSVKMDSYCPVMFMPSLCFKTMYLGNSQYFPVNFGPIVLLFLTKLIIPRSSFLGHLSGIVLGFPLAWGYLSPVTTPVMGCLCVCMYVYNEGTHASLAAWASECAAASRDGCLLFLGVGTCFPWGNDGVSSVPWDEVHRMSVLGVARSLLTQSDAVAATSHRMPSQSQGGGYGDIEVGQDSQEWAQVLSAINRNHLTLVRYMLGVLLYTLWGWRLWAVCVLALGVLQRDWGGTACRAVLGLCMGHWVLSMLHALLHCYSALLYPQLCRVLPPAPGSGGGKRMPVEVSREQRTAWDAFTHQFIRDGMAMGCLLCVFILPDVCTCTGLIVSHTYLNHSPTDGMYSSRYWGCVLVYGILIPVQCLLLLLLPHSLLILKSDSTVLREEQEDCQWWVGWLGLQTDRVWEGIQGCLFPVSLALCGTSGRCSCGWWGLLAPAAQGGYVSVQSQEDPEPSGRVELTSVFSTAPAALLPEADPAPPGGRAEESLSSSKQAAKLAALKRYEQSKAVVSKT